MADRVANYKQVRELHFLDAIPKSASGKILRRILRDESRGRIESFRLAAHDDDRAVGCFREQRELEARRASVQDSDRIAHRQPEKLM